MAVTGKTGADAVAKALHHICRVLIAYRTKLDAVIDLAVSLDAIDSSQASIAHTFLAGADVTCQIFEKVAEISGF